MCIHRIMKFLEQFKVVSRRNKTIRKAFVVTGQPFEGYTMMPLMLCQEPKTKLQRLTKPFGRVAVILRRCCMLFHFISTCIANRLCIETYLVLKGVAWRVAGSETITQNKILVVKNNRRLRANTLLFHWSSVGSDYQL